MARISLIEEKDHPEIAPLIDKIKAVGGAAKACSNVYKLLLHAPPLAETWLDHAGGAVRWKTSISGPGCARCW